MGEEQLTGSTISWRSQILLLVSKCCPKSILWQFLQISFSSADPSPTERGFFAAMTSTLKEKLSEMLSCQEMGLGVEVGGCCLI
jgi:hypothetical protein